MISTDHKNKKGLLVVISGPSGVGKGTVVKHLLSADPALWLSISATTRKPREGEKDGHDYIFLSESVFEEKKRANEFLEWARVHGAYYGTPAQNVKDRLLAGKTVIMEVDVQGAASVKASVDKELDRSLNVVFVFLIPPSMDILAFRLKNRKTEKKEEIESRYNKAFEELQVMEKYDYIVVNDKVESASDKINAIIRVEKERTLLN